MADRPLTMKSFAVAVATVRSVAPAVAVILVICCALVGASALGSDEGAEGGVGLGAKAPLRVGAEVTAAPPDARLEAEIGASAGNAPPPEGLRSADGDADYGFSDLREADVDAAPPLGGGPQTPSRAE